MTEHAQTGLSSTPPTKLLHADGAGIREAAQRLSRGERVAFPTETVFGLGALVTQPEAVAGIFAAKGRPADHPLIAHVAVGFDLTDWADVSSPMARKLIDAFWPGPLTLVVPIGPKMPISVTGGQQSVGLRCPSHPVAQLLLRHLQAPVAAPSANRFGKVSPTQASHVMHELNGRIEAVLEGDQSEVGIESTIVSLLDEQPVLLRPGSITRSDLSAVLGCEVLAPGQTHATRHLRVSGNLTQHYSPDAVLQICQASELTATLAAAKSAPKTAGRSAWVRAVGWSPAFIEQARGLDCTALPMQAETVARRLYEILRQADVDGINLLVFEQPPKCEAWEGVADRLNRAAAR